MKYKEQDRMKQGRNGEVRRKREGMRDRKGGGCEGKKERNRERRKGTGRGRTRKGSNTSRIDHITVNIVVNVIVYIHPNCYFHH